jgi:hypothetical protein
MVVKLSNFELYVAAMVGVRRNFTKSGLTNKVNNKDFGWHCDIEGAAAEMAFAKCFNLYWNFSVNTFKTMPDVDKFEIRHTQRKDGKLIIRPSDIREGNVTSYCLVVGTSPEYRVCGWINDVDAVKDERNWMKGFNNMPDAWFVPQDRLNTEFNWI